MARSRNTADTQTASGGPVSPSIAGKNAVINGGMDIWQRGTTSASITTTSTYTADRWSAVSGASTAITVSRQATGDTTNLPSIQYCARVQRTSGQTGTSVINYFQSFESANSIPFAGKVVTLSFYARAGANYSAPSSLLYATMYTGTGTDQSIYSSFTGSAQPFNTSVTLTTTWQRFTITSSALSSSATQIAVGFLNQPNGTASTNDYFEITGVQLELGSTATPFSRAGGTIQGELAACQRYYWRATPGVGGFASFGTGEAYSSTAAQIHIQSPVMMRSNPSSLEYSTLGVVAPAANVVTFTTLSLSQPGAFGSLLGVTGASGLTAGYAVILVNANSSSAYIALSAEL